MTEPEQGAGVQGAGQSTGNSSGPHGTEQQWATLMRAANQGDAVAYAALLRALAPVLRSVIRARGADLGPETCEDILQDVLLAIHLKRHTWREDEPLRPWLNALARYKVVDAFRARGRRMTIPLEQFNDVLVAEDAVDPAQRRDVLTMIAALDARSADIVRAIGLEGATIRETGTRLEMTEGAVRVALHRALKRLARLRERMME
ncbi:sigma-70 family RNA polymerase sigma factor [Fertoeibacter niger]